MADAPVEQSAGKDAKKNPQLAVSPYKRPIPAFGERVSIAANIIATIGTFLFLVIAPAILLNFVPLPDEFATVLFDTVPLTFPDQLFSALGVALFFLVIGIGFQAWQCRKGLSSWWPLVAAFPVTAILLLPDALARGGSVWAWAMLGAAMALVFCVHWLLVLAAVELID